jgi:hypothetical protein
MACTPQLNPFALGQFEYEVGVDGKTTSFPNYPLEIAYFSAWYILILVINFL